MENFDKIKVFITKCIRREYPNDNIVLINDNGVYNLEVVLLKNNSIKELNICIDFLDEVLKLCNLKTLINIKVNGLSGIHIRLKLISEGLGAVRMFRNGDVVPVYDVYELPTPIIDGIYRDPIACNTDPICQ